jgi:hypothetical protein
MMLPGGLWEQGRLARDFSFKPLSGEVELALGESSASGQSLPAQVTAALAASLLELGGQRVTQRRVADLSVGDRQFLMRQLAVHLGKDQLWLTAQCRQCQQQFDVGLHQSTLPIKQAQGTYPFVSVQTSQGNIKLRVPTGSDQQHIAAMADGSQARQQLLASCIVEGSHEVDSFSSEDMQAMESALEAIAPEVGIEVQSHCPECGAVNVLTVDPYHCLGATATSLFVEIHTLASHYHWSEGEILAMSKQRRQRYLALIDQARGMLS